MDNGNRENNKNDVFKVNIEDDGFLNPEDLDNLTPPPVLPSKKKFEVHIEEDDVQTLDFEDQQPKYKGEIYFSNSRPSKSQNRSAQTERRVQQAAPGGKDKKKVVFNSALAVFCAVVLIFTTALSAIAISCINDVLALGRKNDVVTVTIPSDATTDEIIDILSDEGLVKQKLFCKLYYKAFDFIKNFNKKEKPADPVYLSGVYYVQKNLGLEGYLTEFKETPKTAETITLVFPEGWTIYQMFDKIQEFGVCSKTELIASLKGTDFEQDFVKDIPDNPNRTFKLEGYFYPDTYEFYEKSDANSIIRKFLDESEKKWTDEYEAQRKKLGMTRDEIMTIASIIQREAANTEQMGLISSVIHNRLNHSVSWPTLGCDSTANYITTYVRPNVTADQAVIYEQYYNTYYCQGLPPGPICNPGGDAIKAALFPEDTDYYYFRHDKYGQIYMAKTQAEHDRNGNEVLRANSR